MTRFRVISGQAGKSAACFLLETAGRRLLLDLGREPGTGRPPDLAGLARVDGIILSHGHEDHIGALDRARQIGSPPVHATAPVARDLPAGLDVRMLPLSGRTRIADIPLTTGRTGHAPGGIWLHLDTVEGGVLYTGDMCLESTLYATDPVPPARLAILDGSYGHDDTLQHLRREEIGALMADDRPLLLPAPPRGRGPELALMALEVTGGVPALCPATRAAIQDLLSVAAGSIRDEVRPQLEALRRAPDLGEVPSGIMVAANADASGGAAAAMIERWRNRPCFRIVFTGHVPPGTPAAELLANGKALWRRWNVHPLLAHNLELARAARAEIVLLAFSDAGRQPEVACAFAPARVASEQLIEL